MIIYIIRYIHIYIYICIIVYIYIHIHIIIITSYHGISWAITGYNFMDVYAVCIYICITNHITKHVGIVDIVLPKKDAEKVNNFYDSWNPMIFPWVAMTCHGIERDMMGYQGIYSLVIWQFAMANHHF